MSPKELELMKELAAAGRQGRTVLAANRSGLARMIEKHYVKAGTFLRLDPRHTAHDRHVELIVSGRVPIKGFPEIGKSTVCHDGSVCVLDLIQHLVDVRAADLINA